LAGLKTAPDVRLTGLKTALDARLIGLRTTPPLSVGNDHQEDNSCFVQFNGY
jgi:hypothetical protein